MLSVSACIHTIYVGLLATLLYQYWTLWSLQHATSCKDSDAAKYPSSLEYDHRHAFPNVINSASESSESADVSSVWCWGNHHTNRICYFRNLYYLPTVDEFVFVHGDDSVYVGLPADRYDPALLDMSSIADHNTQYFNFVDADAGKMQSLIRSATVVEMTSVIFRRFHPENLMHVLHDDLLPMFHTVSTLLFLQDPKLYSRFPVYIQPVFADGWDPGPFEELYSLFSTAIPLYMSNLSLLGLPVRFREAYVGVSKHTLWYQYGFVDPQGPIRGSNVTSYDLQLFCRFVRARLNITDIPSDKDRHLAVLLSRKYNRLLLNEVDLALALVQNFELKVATVSLETHTLHAMIEIVSKASLLIGMHGSLLALAMFLPPGSTLVELFPYAVNPAHYTPYQTLANIPGMDITYVSWQNIDPDRTVAHPERSWHEGGIVHLSENEQQRITASSEVPVHLCCQHAEWLYRIYQDTYVDIDAVMLLIRGTLSKRTTHSSPVNSKKLYPSYVCSIVCHGSPDNDLPSLHVSWQPPVNLQYVEASEVKYEVWIQEADKDDYSAWILSENSYTFMTGIEPRTSYNVWIRCILDEVLGPFNIKHVFCTT